MGTRTRTRPDESRKPGRITPDGRLDLQRQIEKLWVEQREMARAVEIAAAEGDRSENAEYTYSKIKLAGIHRKLGFLSNRIEVLTVVPQPPPDDDRVHFGCWVELEDDEGETHRYRIVGADETKLDCGHISEHSPVAQALLGRELDDDVIVNRPKGKARFTITEIFVEDPES